MERPRLALADFASLIAPQAAPLLEPLCQKSRALTLRRFGKVIRLFAPIYVSNECVNNCKYCGFSRDNPILRVTLSIPELQREAQALKAEGFRNILLVAGEHPKFVSNGYLRDCVRVVHADCPSVSLEVAPLSVEDYKPLVNEGADGLVVYQETYDRSIYAEMHTSGPKRDFAWRLETPERGYEAGFRRLGISALYGLGDWRYEALCVAAHADFLLRNCWKSQITISMPRLRPCAGSFQPRSIMTDRDLVQLVCAFRLFLPDIGLVLSTRESPKLRNGLIPLGITMISAGSHTEPGGYTGVGQERLHQTVRGRIQEHAPASGERATGQFDIADERSPREVADLLRHMGYEPVWKDWDTALTS
jgi:2-iminoacetate synthase